jgi:hypothetical protein
MNNAGIYLLNANHNQIKGKKHIQQNPIQFYISTLYQKNNYNLSDVKQLISFSKAFLNLFMNDFLEQLYYFPSNPPEQEGHILSTEYLHIVKNKIGIVLEKCSNNIIQQTWIQENEKGIINRNNSDEINSMIFNFISGNNIGVVWDNASLDGFELNNICYNTKNTIIFASTTDNFQNYKPYQLLFSGNIVLNNDSFFPIFDYITFNVDQAGLNIIKKISSIVNYLTILPLLIPFTFSKVSQILRNETIIFLKYQIMLGMICIFFPIFLKIIKLSNEPPLISELYY